jgi:hypothetical protein
MKVNSWITSLSGLDLGVTLGSGSTLGTREVRLFEFIGDNYEMGYQQGLQLREAISLIAANIHRFESLRADKPPILPMRLYLYLAARRAINECLPDVVNFYPRQRKRLEGLSKGSQIGESFFLLMMSAELMVTHVNYRIGACTAAAITAERCTLGEPVIIKNFDFPLEFQSFYITRRSQPLEGNGSVEVTTAPMVGCHDGINDRGLAVSYNYGFGTDLPKFMAPVSLVVQEILENCATVEEAVNYAVESKRAGGAILLFGDASGRLATVELSPNFSGVREPVNGILVNTNHYLSSEMTPYDIPSNAYYTPRNIRSLRGIRVQESSELRYGRAMQLLDREEPLGIKEIVEVFSDHGEGGRGNDNTICRHGNYLSTTCSVIMLPLSKRILVTYGSPCESVYTDFKDIFSASDSESEETQKE